MYTFEHPVCFLFYPVWQRLEPISKYINGPNSVVLRCSKHCTSNSDVFIRQTGTDRDRLVARGDFLNHTAGVAALALLLWHTFLRSTGDGSFAEDDNESESEVLSDTFPI